MMTTIDTNVLVRTLVADGSAQAQIATQLFQEASMLLIPMLAFCETAWVLRSRYGKKRRDVATAFQRLLHRSNVTCDHEAVRFGILALTRGADFADAVIALEGERLGGTLFISFDRKAVRHLASLGRKTHLLG